MIVSVNTTALADPPPESSPREIPNSEASRQPPIHWYGYQTLAVDAGVVVLGLSAAAAGASRHETALTDALGGAAVAGYLIGGPIVHWAHRRAGTGFASLGLRVGAPLALSVVGFGVGEAACSSDHGDSLCPAVTAAVGGILGFPAAVLADAFWLAREPASLETAASGFSLFPDIAYVRRGFVAGLGGTL